VDARGVTLSLVVTGANRHDETQSELVLEKLKDTYMALLHTAAVIIAFRKVGVIYG
jgi:hypothetical protein